MKNDERQVKLPAQQRSLSVLPATWNAERRTIDVIASTGARVPRMDMWTGERFEEELVMDPAAISMERLNSGAPVLNTHQSGSLGDQIGVVVPGSARVEGGQLVAQIQLSARDDVAPIAQDIADGIIRNISIGYMVSAYEVEKRSGAPDLWRATRWEPFEISFVPVPADSGAQVRSTDAGQGGFPCIIRRAGAPATAQEEIRNMDRDQNLAGEEVTPAAVAETPHAVETETRGLGYLPSAIKATRLREMARSVGLSVAHEVELIARHADQPFTSEDAAWAMMRQLDAAEARSDVRTISSRATVTVDGNEKLRAAAFEAIHHRQAGLSTPLKEGGEHFRGLPMREIWAELAGIRTRGMSPVQLVDKLLSTRFTHVTGDFPTLLASVEQKFLRSVYETMTPNFADFVTIRQVRDFKSIVSTAVSAPPPLARLPEGAEIQWGKVEEEGEIYAVSTFARGFTVTRQMLVNDDLDAFAGFTQGWAFRAREVEHDLVYTAILVGNPNMRVGGAFFQNAAVRGNNLAATPAAINTGSVNLGRATIRKQKGPNGETWQGAPTHLIVGPDKELEAEQMVTTNMLASQTSAFNPFGGRLSLVVDSRLTGNIWFLVDGSPARRPIEMAYLDGAAGPQITEHPGANFDGIGFKATFDVGAAPVQFRSAFRNNGA